MIARPLNVLICGSNYARSYVDALALEPSRYRIRGILARGSERSVNLAAHLGQPLYRAVSALPDDINLACAAMGSAAFDVVSRLLRRGIHTLCEHPLGTEALRACLAAAVEGKACFHVNAHFGDLDAPRAWIRQARDGGAPRRLEVEVADRALYGCLDIARQALDRLEPVQLGPVDRSPPWTRLEARLGEIASSFRVQTEELPDGSPDYQVDCRMSLELRQGTLRLDSLRGPLTWRKTGSTAATRVPEARPEAFRRQRLEANLAAVERLVGQIDGGGTPDGQTPDQLSESSSAWDSLSERLCG